MKRWMAAAVVLGAAPSARACVETSSSEFGAGMGILDGVVSGAWLSTDTDPGDDECFSFVSVDMWISHGYVGDLSIDVGYDRDCDGSVDTEFVSLLCRPGTACEPGGDRGCSGSISGSYTWSDLGSGPLAEPCQTSHPPDCYAPAEESVATFAEAFAGEELGGCFRIHVVDHESDGIGFIKQFEMNFDTTTCSATPTETASWRTVKLRFDD